MGSPVDELLNCALVPFHYLSPSAGVLTMPDLRPAEFLADRYNELERH